MLELYSPKNEVELALLKSILNGEEISYFVRNDNFGSMEVGPRIELLNKKMIMVEDSQYEKAKEIISVYLGSTEEKFVPLKEKYSPLDIVRMAIEFFLFGWIMPGSKKSRKVDDE